MRVSGKLTAVFLASAMMIPGFQVTAQESVLEEVIVVAQKREENLQEIPLAVSVINAQEMINRGIVRVDDFGTYLPNVLITGANSVRVTRFAIRGVGTEPNNVGLAQSIPVYIDGVLQGTGGTWNNAMFDLQDIEVLRGPQSTLFGDSSIGGAILIRTRRPDTEKFGVRVRANAGNKGLLQGDATLNIPLGSRAAFTVSGSRHERDGFEYNETLDRDMNAIDSTAGRVQFLFQPSDDVDILLRAGATKDRGECCHFDFGSSFDDPATTDRVVHQNFLNVTDRDTEHYSAEIHWDFNNLTFTSITAYQEYDYVNRADTDGTAQDFLHTGVNTDQEQFSQEFRFASNGGEKFDWVAGIYYLDEEVTQPNIAFDGLINIFFGPGFILDVGEGTRKTEIISPFGQIDFYLSESLTAVAGLRYSVVDSEAHKFQSPLAAAFGLPPFDQTIEDEDKEWSGTLKLLWQASENAMLYGSYSRGFKQSGYNLLPGGEAADGTGFFDFSANPEFVDAYELGLKTEFMDNRARINAAAFYYDYTDLQRSRFEFTGDIPILVFGNAGKAEATGVEIESTFAPAAGLLLGLNFGYIDAELKEFETASSDFSGNRPHRTPKTSFSGFVQYSITDLGRVDVLTRADYINKSSWFDSDANRPDRRQESVGLLNVRLAVQDKQGRWEVAAWARNLTDKLHHQGFGGGLGLHGPNEISRSHSPGRTYGLEFSLHTRQ